MAYIELGRDENDKPVSIDLNTLLSTRMLITASSGGGKSETLRRIIEEASKHIQVIVIDPEGEFATLREKFPFVLVGEGGEVPADIRTAELLATKLLELQASAVCDLYEMKPIHDRHVWVQRFLTALVEAPKELWHPVLVFLDEAHVYSPERSYGESCANDAVMNLASLGRKRGFCLIAATQRLSKLNKNTIEPLQNFIVGRTTYDDQKRAAGVFKIDPGAATRKFSLELERLKAGHFIVRGHAFNKDMARVKVTRGETRPPATGSVLAGRMIPTPEAIKALLPKLAELPHDAAKKQKEDEQMQQKLREVEGELMTLTDELAELSRKIGIVEAESERVKETLRQAQHIARQLVVCLESDNIEATIEAYARDTSAAYRERFPQSLAGEKAAVRAAVTSEEKQAMDMTAYFIDGVQRGVSAEDTEQPPPAKAAKPNGEAKLRPGALRMLAALAQWYPRGRSEGQVATAARMKRKGGSWTSYKSELNTSGLIEMKDGMMHATAVGRAYFGDKLPKTPMTTAEVVEMWNAKLRPGARRMLRELIKVRGNTLSRSALAELSGVSDAGGSFSSYLSELRTAGLITADRNGIRANKETLFL